METPQSHALGFQTPGFISPSFNPPGSLCMMHNICCPVYTELLLKPLECFFFFLRDSFLHLTSFETFSTRCTRPEIKTHLLMNLHSLKVKILIHFFSPGLLSMSCGSLTPVQLTNNNIRFCFSFSPPSLINSLLVASIPNSACLSLKHF